MKTKVFFMAILVAILCVPVQAQTLGTPVFNNIPAVVPPNVPSQGFQCCQGREIGDEIQLEAYTPRQAGFATVLMSSWSLHSNYPTMPAAGYTHPITLNIYTDATSAFSHSPVKTVTQNFVIPWRPVADPTCAGGTAWRAADGNCYNGLAFTIVFDLKGLNYDLPDQFIYGVAFNTNTWGYEPIGLPGPYESLNVGTANVNGVALSPSVGVDVNPDVVYWNTLYGPFYTDGGSAGIGVLRPDTGWASYPIAVRFTTFGTPKDKNDCKNGAWQNLVRSDFTPFKNQGDCVSYVNTGK